MLDSLPNLHPFLVHFPIALFLSAVAGDLVLVAFARSSWLDRALTLAYGLAATAALAAAVSGKLAEPELAPPSVVDTVGAHGDWAFLTVVLVFITAFVRFDAFWRDRGTPAPRLHRARVSALALALVAAVALVRTADYGGRLVYQHGVGVFPQGKER